MRKGQEFEASIDEVRFPNTGIISAKDKDIRLRGVLKGAKGLVRITRKKKNFYEAKIIDLYEKSPLETEEPCPHFGICGGCTYQTMTYENELKYKEEQVRNLFKEAGIDVEVGEVEPSPDIKHYRNKMEFTFGDEYRDGPLSLGMHRRGRFYEIENVEHCNIAGPDFTKILTNSLDYFKKTDLTFYNKRSHEGNLRNVVIRKALSTGDILVNLVTSSQKEIEYKGFIDMILGLELEGKVVGILHTINDGVADMIRPDKTNIIWGQDFIMEEICGLKFKISPFSFFQTNTYAAEKLYNITQDFIGDIKGQLVFDLFSGTGTISQIMAQVASEVVSVELVEEAVEMARYNAELNGIDNIEFIAGDVFKVMDTIDKKPDLIVIDPPRPGLENSIDKVLAFNPKSYVYVSCNPTTLVRDLQAFIEKGYEIKRIQLVDQFPRTPHVEAVTLLTRSETSCK